ncbi:hypothetical protein Glove_437g54 [Diversispora epigaea]|uniref:Uncharacterized protein n=1 Tax=Diversispora epigaea TaxID=1348612 RepID=A0A397GXJ8_9GLOM|nr:hypothetical protein Glove_437g54 [Diversispora epigaea]
MDNLINNLKIRLRKAEVDAQSNDKNISTLELQLQDMSNKISSLQHRIYKLREGMSLTTPSTSVNVFTLINETKVNIRVLFDSVRGENNLLNNKINNLQAQIKLKLTQIQNKYHAYEYKNRQLRERLTPDYETEVGRLQMIINEQRNRIDELDNEAQNWYQRANQLQDRYDTVLNERDRYRTKCFQQEETLRGIYENMAHEGADQLYWEDENAKLKGELHIAGLQIIALRVRRLILTNKRYALWQEANNKAQHYRHEYHLQGQQLQQCQDRKTSHIKWKNRERNSRQLILNLNQQIFTLQNNPPINNQHIRMAGYAPKPFHGGTNLKNKNWELQNISDNTNLTNLHAINGLANNNALLLVSAHTVFDEDWLTSGGRPTDLTPNAPNANAGDKFSVSHWLTPKKNRGNTSKNVEVDSDEKLVNLTQRQLKLHIARQVNKVVKKSSKHRYSGCGRTEHHSNSSKCLKNKKKNRSKKKGNVNKVILDTNNSFSSDSGSDSETGSDAENISPESDSENNFTEDNVVKIINVVNAAKAKKK